MSSLKLTVVICTHNRADLLMQAIHSLNSAVRPENCELAIMVIANACRDKSTEQLQRYRAVQQKSGTIPLQYREEPRPGKSLALNLALKKVTDGYICFVDDDHRVDSCYLTAIAEVIRKHPDCPLFCGRIIPDWTGEEPPWVHFSGQYRIYPLPVPHFELGTEAMVLDESHSIPGGGNLIVNTSLFKQIGGFNTALGPKGHNLLGSEDSDFILRALSAKQELRYVPSITQYHWVDIERLQLRYLLQKSYQRTRSITLTRHPEHSQPPRYLWRKLFEYSIQGLSCFSQTKGRFYMMRVAATLGEIAGYWGHTR
ncbi:MAG: glycosyltransferase family 2 protein [Porticoccaceae bacterium]|nr:glycosyltransferase family 2 protein [Porticoccaceae bacterium]